jgi:hypothetical protein
VKNQKQVCEWTRHWPAQKFRRSGDLRDIAMRQYDGWDAAGRRGLERDGLIRVAEVRLRLMVLVTRRRQQEQERIAAANFARIKLGLWWPASFRPDPRKWWNRPEMGA